MERCSDISSQGVVRLSGDGLGSARRDSTADEAAVYGTILEAVTSKATDVPTEQYWSSLIGVPEILELRGSLMPALGLPYTLLGLCERCSNSYSCQKPRRWRYISGPTFRPFRALELFSDSRFVLNCKLLKASLVQEDIQLICWSTWLKITYQRLSLYSSTD